MKQKKNNKLILLIIMFSFIVVLGAGIFVMIYYYRTMSPTESAREYDQYYVMIADDQSDYWKSIYESAYEKGQQLNIYVDLMGKDLLQGYTKTELMEIAIASKVDGIILAADESEEMTQLIDEAINDGIMVVTVQGDNSNSKRCSYVSVGTYDLGIEYGKQILSLARERMRQDAGKSGEDNGYYDKSGYYVTGSNRIDVAVLVDVADSAQNVIRLAIQETLEEEKDIDVAVSFSPIEQQYEFAEEEAIRDIFMNTKQPDIIVCLSEQSTVCAYQTVVDYNKVGQVDILGYYVSESILNAIDRGVVYSTLTVDTEQMGAYCVEALEEYSRMGNTSQFLTVGTSVINKDNVVDYLGGDENNEE